jgi:endonuclease/exonuclease/phosphatase (EEP) superfamily protein YafD
MNESPPEPEAFPTTGVLARCGRWGGRIAMTLCDFVAIAAGAIALFAFTASISWAADLCCQFRVQLAMFLIPTTVFYWVCKRGTVAWWLLVCTIVNLLPLMPYLVPKAPVPTANAIASADANVTRVMLLNVLQGNRHHDKVVAYIHEHTPDIFIALEADQERTKGLKPIWSSYPHRHIIDDRGTSSVAAYSRIPFDSVHVHHSTRHRLPTLELNVTLNQKPMQIFATHPYVPLTQETARMRNQQLDELEDMLGPSGERILLGDFNCVPWSPHFTDLLSGTGLTPAGYGSGLWPTWYRRARAYGPLRNTWVFALKLDHVLLSDDLQVIHHHVGPCLGSDHRPVTVDFVRVNTSP